MNQRKIVCALAVVAKYDSIAEAARAKNTTRANIHEALYDGRRAGGVWWVEAEFMTGPFKNQKNVPVVCEDGQAFESRADAVRAAVGGTIDRETYHREYMNLMRKIRTGKPYRGKVYRLEYNRS